MKMKKCSECGGKMKETSGEYEEGIRYRHWRCEKCGDEVLDMDQLEELAKKYRKLRRETYWVKVSRWGTALALRIPKSIVKKQSMNPGEKVRIIPEKFGFKVIPQKE